MKTVEFGRAGAGGVAASRGRVAESRGARWGPMVGACVGAVVVGLVVFFGAASTLVPGPAVPVMAAYTALMAVAGVLAARRCSTHTGAGRAVAAGAAFGLGLATAWGGFWLLFAIGMAAEHGH